MSKRYGFSIVSGPPTSSPTYKADVVDIIDCFIVSINGIVKTGIYFCDVQPVEDSIE
jgi:hypothetical protein